MVKENVWITSMSTSTGGHQETWHKRGGGRTMDRLGEAERRHERGGGRVRHLPKGQSIAEGEEREEQNLELEV